MGFKVKQLAILSLRTLTLVEMHLIYSHSTSQLTHILSVPVSIWVRDHTYMTSTQGGKGGSTEMRTLML